MAFSDLPPHKQSDVFYFKVEKLLDKIDEINNSEAASELEDAIFKIQDAVENRDYADQSIKEQHLKLLNEVGDIIDDILNHQNMHEEGKGDISNKMRRRKAQMKKKKRTRQELEKLPDDELAAEAASSGEPITFTSSTPYKEIKEKEIEAILTAQEQEDN